MGHPKATLPWGDGTFVSTALRTLASGGLGPLVMVCGAHAPETRAALPRGIDVDLLENPAPERGQLSSLKLALGHLASQGTTTGAIVSLIDHPNVRVDTILRIREAGEPARIVVPRHDDRRGHPVYFGRALWDEILAADDAGGARVVVRRDPARVRELATDDPGVLVDVDTPADFATLRASNRGANRGP